METGNQINYRKRIYDEYVSAFKGKATPDELLRAAQQHARFFDHLFQPLLQNGLPERVLEIGCGAGHFLYWALQRGISSVRGFDLSGQQVEAALALGLPAEEAAIQIFLPQFQEEFDWLVALDLVEHLTRDEGLEFLDLCHASLRSGGTLFLTTPNGAAIRPGPVAAGDLTHETIYTPQTISLALRLAGFTDIEVYEIAPPRTSLRSRIRRILWQFLRLAPMLIDLIETGGAATRVYSRVMAVRARRS